MGIDRKETGRVGRDRRRQDWCKMGIGWDVGIKDERGR